MNCGNCGHPRDDLNDGAPGEVQVAPEPHRVPCPVCGAKSIKAHLVAHEDASVSDKATGEATRGNTQRTAPVLNTEDGAPFQDVQAYYNNEVNTDGVDCSHPMAKNLVTECEALTSRAYRATMYKARLNLRKGQENDVNQFGAYRLGASKPGRYNPGGGVVLYLAASPQLARAEIQARPEDKAYAWEYNLDLAPYPIGVMGIDIDDKAPHLHALLFLAESLAVSTEQDYGASLLVRKCAEQAGLSGIQYPSCRGYLHGIVGGKNLVVWGDAIEAAEKCMVDAESATIIKQEDTPKGG